MDHFVIGSCMTRVENGGLFTIKIPDEKDLIAAVHLYVASWAFQLAGGADVCHDPDYTPHVKFTIDGEERIADSVYPLTKSTVLLGMWDEPEPGHDSSTGLLFGAEFTDDAGWVVCGNYSLFHDDLLEKMTDEMALYIFRQLTGRYIGR